MGYYPIDNNEKLFFSKGNARLNRRDTVIFNLPAGWTCPGARECLAKAHRDSGIIEDGKDQQYRCYAANSERQYKAARDSRWRNFELLKGKSRQEMKFLISTSIPSGFQKIRIHESGDFFSHKLFSGMV